MALEWTQLFAHCGECWLIRLVWVRGNVAYCQECRPDWCPQGEEGGE